MRPAWTAEESGRTVELAAGSGGAETCSSKRLGRPRRRWKANQKINKSPTFGGTNTRQAVAAAARAAAVVVVGVAIVVAVVEVVVAVVVGVIWYP